MDYLNNAISIIAKYIKNAVFQFTQYAVIIPNLKENQPSFKDQIALNHLRFYWSYEYNAWISYFHAKS